MSNEEYLVPLVQFLPFYSNKILLMEYFGSAEKIWQADEKQLSALGLPEKVIREFDRYRRRIDPKKYLNDLALEGIKWLTIKDKNYPENLKGLKDYPLVLFYKGSLTK